MSSYFSFIIVFCTICVANKCTYTLSQYSKIMYKFINLIVKICITVYVSFSVCCLFNVSNLVNLLYNSVIILLLFYSVFIKNDDSAFTLSVVLLQAS